MIITKIVGASMAVVASVGYVFHDEIMPPEQLPVLQVYCDAVTLFDEFTTPILSGCRYEGYPVRVRLPALNPY